MHHCRRPSDAKRYAERSSHLVIRFVTRLGKEPFREARIGGLQITPFGVVAGIDRPCRSKRSFRGSSDTPQSECFPDRDLAAIGLAFDFRTRGPRLKFSADLSAFGIDGRMQVRYNPHIEEPTDSRRRSCRTLQRVNSR
jgi:hypothetical protein